MSSTRRRTSAVSVLALVVGLLPFTAAVPALAEENPATTVFINEFHYDNTGTDEGEFIEVAGPAGTDLTGWSIVLYNGNGGAVYDTDALAGTIPDEGDGYGTVALTYPSNGIQNGAPDGIALVDGSSNVVQFLSYEGSFTGVGGPADGVASTDIGVLQDGSGPVGASLQLQGTGLAYGDFSWVDSEASPGATNTGQTFDTPPPPSTPFINELHYDNAGTDEGEFVEIAGPAGMDLSGWSIVLYNGATGAVYDTDALSGLIPDEGSGFGAVVVTYPSNGLQNGAPDGLALVDDSGAVVQFLSYEGTLMGVGGAADGVTSTDIGVFQDGNGPVGVSLQLTGTGSAYSEFTWTSATESPGCLNDGQTDIAGACGGAEPAGLVISQVYGGGGNSGATFTNDFVEIYNPTDDAVDLTGWSVQYASSAGFAWNVTTLSGSIQSGGYYLVQQAAGSGGTTPLPAPDATGTAFMAAGAGKVALSTTIEAVGADCDAALATAVDFVGYGDAANCFEGSGPTATLTNTTAALRLGGGCVDTDDNAADFEAGSPDPRNSASPVNDCNAPPRVCPLAPEVTPISMAQGSDDNSPCAGEMVVIEGVVVGDYEGPSPALRGFYVQEEDGDQDADPATSEGIFVFHGDEDLVDLGDVVRVTGTVAEFQGQTQLGFPESLTIQSPGNAVTPAEVTMPFPSATYLERYEGMLVEFDQTLYVTEFFQLGRFGQVVVSSDDRLAQPTNVVEPGAAAVALQEANNLSRLIIDDGDNAQNPDPLVFGRGGNELTAANTLRGGDTITGAVGVLTYTWAGNSASGNAYRLRPINDLSDSGLVDGGVVPEFQPANPRPTARPDVGGSLSVASFNVLNYFLTLDDGGNDCGPVGFAQECRGAEDSFEFERQRTKLLAALVELDVDVLALMELENTPGVEPVADLVAGLNGILGADTYGYVDTGVIGTDVIRTGLIYRTDAVSQVGAFAILDSSVDPRFDDDLNRPTLAQSFEDLATGATFTVAVNHLKSKGCGGATGPDMDQGDGQGCWNAARTAAAEAMVDWLSGYPTGAADDDVLITGDLNSYAKEDPIAVFSAAGYVDLHSHYGGEDAYSYVFDGQWGYLDHALASASLFTQVTGAESYHINADEPSVLDFNTNFKTANQVDLLFAPDEFRTSDHDPVVVGLDLDVPLPAWSATQIYNSGDRVTHNGKVYEALWWTKGQVPGASATGPWQEMAETADGVAIWTPSRVFNAGDRAVHNGKTYEALWWTRNQVPGSPTGPWQEMAETADGTPIWTPSRVFNAGDIVFHDGNLYEARWRNRNVEPTGSGPWRLLE